VKIVLKKPAPRDWKVANRFLDHPGCCRCSTCELAASLGATIRNEWVEVDHEVSGVSR
jgi:hypothetical protein